jgi:hypothetical protein
MTPEEREHMNKLCAQIQVERDPRKFTTLIRDLNELLEKKERRLEERDKHQPV